MNTPAANPIRRVVNRGGRHLPRGWRDFWLQFAIFWSFYVAYEGSRTLAQSDRYVAMRNALDVLRAQQLLGIDWERGVQVWAINAPSVVMTIANWTYFNCQFTITYALLLFIYFRRNHAFYFIRNALLSTSLAALLGYILLPTAPPRMMGGLGFIDTLQQTAVNHNSGLIQWFANPYAAMPSLHTAYAVIIGCAGVLVFSHPLLRAIWALYPGLVVFSIIATANHWFLDAAVGAFVALFALLFAFAVSRGRIPTLTRARTTHRAAPPPTLGGDPLPQRA
ncbi:MAG: phosphatase PAP2 family protein [Thermoleophilia bacterium]|nr:phosphatase PAP2 family protein [Thermoleophilia bacterium]